MYDERHTQPSGPRTEWGTIWVAPRIKKIYIYNEIAHTHRIEAPINPVYTQCTYIQHSKRLLLCWFVLGKVWRRSFILYLLIVFRLLNVSAHTIHAYIDTHTHTPGEREGGGRNVRYVRCTYYHTDLAHLVCFSLSQLHEYFSHNFSTWLFLIFFFLFFLFVCALFSLPFSLFSIPNWNRISFIYSHASRCAYVICLRFF